MSSRRIPDTCAECLYRARAKQSGNEQYLAAVRERLENRTDDESAPYLAYEFDRLYEEMCGTRGSMAGIKHHYNELMLSLEQEIRTHIRQAQDPLSEALVYARVGNYIDFGTLEHVDEKEFFSLFENASMSPEDQLTYAAFLKQCEQGGQFLLLLDNCGEIVLDKIFLEELHDRFPHLKLSVIVRGGEAANDATVEDALQTGIDRIADVYENGMPLMGTLYSRLPKNARQAFDEADVILSKGQGNYETLSGQGYHVFYLFLCKCDYFVRKFGVPRLTGIFAEET